MLTEQKPPWAAKFGVPYCCANQPVSAWLWSRPVKNARRDGSVLRTSPSHAVAIVSASSQEIVLELARSALADPQHRRLEPRGRHSAA